MEKDEYQELCSLNQDIPVVDDVSYHADPDTGPGGTQEFVQISEGQPFTADNELCKVTSCHNGNCFSDDNVGSLKRIDEKLDSITTSEQRLFSEVREMHKLYHNEFSGRLQSMQNELEEYRKIEKGRVFDDILGAIARIYVSYETLADEVENPKARQNIKYMLWDIEDLLKTYGAEIMRSKPGDKRNARYCQIRERITTNDLAKHDTVAKSHNTGFYIRNKAVIKETVDIYLYEAPATEPETQDIQAAQVYQDNTDNVESDASSLEDKE